jgi:acetate kinase
MEGAILTINAGSSSLKVALFDAALAPLASGLIEGLGTDPEFALRDGAGNKILVDHLEGTRYVADHAGALRIALEALRARFPALSVAAVGHRVVHGGMDYAAPVVVDDAVFAQLKTLEPLAPLHQPHNLAGIAACRAVFPGVPQIACFDTAFHRAHPRVSDVFALPRALYDEGVRRYGFHGLSYEYVSGHLNQIAPFHAQGRVVVCHLGSGASLCATRGGLSVASTMGFSALDGLPMGTRPGQIDPGILLYLMSEKGMDAKAISDLLYKKSGLLGLSGISNDMRDLLASEAPEAHEAVEYFVSRVRREIGAMAAVLEGLDALVFCGGIGENAAPIREFILEGMGWIGVELDRARNRAGLVRTDGERAAEAVISSDRSRVQVFVIRTDEEKMIATHARDALVQSPEG